MTNTAMTAVRRSLLMAAIIMFTLYCGNIVVAKASSLLSISVPLLSNFAEFVLLLLATGCFVTYALCREAMYGGEEIPETSVSDQSEKK